MSNCPSESNLFILQPHEMHERIMNAQNDLQYCKSKVSPNAGQNEKKKNTT